MTHLETPLRPSCRVSPTVNTANRAGALHRCSAKPRNPASRSAIRVLSRKEQVLRFQPRSERVDGVQLLFAVSCSSQPAYHIVAVKPLPALVFTRISDRIVDRANCPGRFGKRMNVPSWFSTNSQSGMDKKIIGHELKIAHPVQRFRKPHLLWRRDHGADRFPCVGRYGIHIRRIDLLRATDSAACSECCAAGKIPGIFVGNSKHHKRRR
jgi:hypothetical protein